MVDTSLIAVFLLGLFGGVHCAGMCGGIVAALALASKRSDQLKAAQTVHFHNAMPTLAGSIQTKSNTLPGPVSGGSFLGQPLRSTFSFNLARVSMYTLLGGIAGAVGSLGFLLDSLLPVQQIALTVANLVLILMGLYIFGVSRITRTVEQLGQPVWRRVQPLAARSLSVGHGPGIWVAGALWGLVPCGLVYTVLIASMTTASPTEGAMLMAAFGAGTLPNLMLMGLSARWLATVRKNIVVRRVMGLFFIVIGLSGLLHIDSVLSLPLIGELCFRPT